MILYMSGNREQRQGIIGNETVDQEVGGSNPPSCTNLSCVFSKLYEQADNCDLAANVADPMRTPLDDVTTDDSPSRRSNAAAF